MGLDNKVTAERYRTIKNYIEQHDLGTKDDVMVGRIFGLKITAIRQIRNTRDYEEYCSKSSTYRRHEQRSHSKTAIMPSSGLELVEIPLTIERKDRGMDLAGLSVIVILIITILGFLFVLCALVEGI